MFPPFHPFAVEHPCGFPENEFVGLKKKKCAYIFSSFFHSNTFCNQRQLFPLLSRGSGRSLNQGDGASVISKLWGPEESSAVECQVHECQERCLPIF